MGKLIGLKKKISLVRWEKITLSKEYGGLGIKQMHYMNLALMAKLGWRLLTEQNCLWTKVMIGKYIRGAVV